MLLQDLKDHYGSYYAMTKALHLAPTTYLHWKKRGGIPYPTQCVIEKETNRRFLAEKAHERSKI